MGGGGSVKPTRDGAGRVQGELAMTGARNGSRGRRVGQGNAPKSPALNLNAVPLSPR